MKNAADNDSARTRFRSRPAFTCAVAALAAAHLCLNVFNNINVWRHYVMPTLEVYNRVPPERRVFVKTEQENAAIMNIRALLPQDARILWIPDVWRMANYYVYPRKIFQERVFKQGEEIVLDRDFIRSRRITHVYVAADRILAVRDEAAAGAAQAAQAAGSAREEGSADRPVNGSRPKGGRGR